MRDRSDGERRSDIVGREARARSSTELVAMAAGRHWCARELVLGDTEGGAEILALHVGSVQALGAGSTLLDLVAVAELCLGHGISLLLLVLAGSDVVLVGPLGLVGVSLQLGSVSHLLLVVGLVCR